MNNAAQLGPFGHTLRNIAAASGSKEDISRWNDYAFKLSAKLDAAKKAQTATEWYYSRSFHSDR